MNFLKKIVKNKVILYLITRYFTYFAQFVSSIIIAIKLGPYYFGIWGFLLLLINYFRITNFGIANATNILVVQHKENEARVKSIVSASFVSLAGLSLLILLLATYYYFFGIPFFQKYEVGKLFYGVCFIAILAHFNVLLMNIYRIKNRLFEVAFQQSAIPILIFVICFFFTGKTLLYNLLGVYILGNILALSLFLFKRKIPWGGSFSFQEVKAVINKGFYLFLYNVCFYLIIVSIKTIVSIYYSVEHFGFFTFSYSLANSILLFLQALAFIVTPKVIDKLKSNDLVRVQHLIKEIRQSYVSLAFGLAFIALMLFPLFLWFVPKYQEALTVIQLSVLTVVLYTNSFGYSTFLMAQNKEKTIAKIASFSLMLNVALALALVMLWQVSYEYVILATTVTYTLYTYLCVYFGKKQLNSDDGFYKNFTDCFQLSLLIPYLIAIGVVLLEQAWFYPLPFLVYAILNKNAIKAIVHKIKTIINKPNIIDL